MGQRIEGGVERLVVGNGVILVVVRTYSCKQDMSKPLAESSLKTQDCCTDEALYSSSERQSFERNLAKELAASSVMVGGSRGLKTTTSLSQDHDP